MIEDYVRNAVLCRVIDGDTLEVDLDLGFGIWLRKRRVRVLGVDCPEMTGATREAGQRAKEYTTAWLLEAGTFQLQTHIAKDMDNFGRVLAVVRRWKVGEGEIDLATDLLSSGNAVPLLMEMREYGVTLP